MPDHALEFVILRLVAIGAIEKPPLFELDALTPDTELRSGKRRKVHVADARELVTCEIFDREVLAPGAQFEGPAIVEEWSTTILILPDQQVTVDRFGDLLIHEKN